MRVYEMTQRAEGGGRPCPNDGPFNHGEPVVIVSKRELATVALMALRRPNSPSTKDELLALLALGDSFLCPIALPQIDKARG